MVWSLSMSPIYVVGAVAVLALILSILALFRSGRGYPQSPSNDSSRSYDQFFSEETPVNNLEGQLRVLTKHLGELEVKQANNLQRYAMVRFRAFPEVGSDLSFSLALLDGNSNGIIITSLFGRDQTRVFGKTIQGGKSEYRLSPEEEQALREAIGSFSPPQHSQTK